MLYLATFFFSIFNFFLPQSSFHTYNYFMQKLSIISFLFLSWTFPYLITKKTKQKKKQYMYIYIIYIYIYIYIYIEREREREREREWHFFIEEGHFHIPAKKYLWEHSSSQIPPCKASNMWQARVLFLALILTPCTLI